MRILSLARGALVTLALVSPTISHAAPDITSPVVAAMPAEGKYSIAIGGTGFGPEVSTSSVQFTGAYAATFIATNADVAWSATQITVKNIPDIAVVRAQVKVVVNGSASGTANVAYFHDSYDVPAGTNNGSPLAIAMSDSSKLWINQEFHSQFWRLDTLAATTTALSAANNVDIFAWPTWNSSGVVTGASSVSFSAGGEDVQVHPDGSAWFTESGAWPYNNPPLWTPDNHSRIVRYNAEGTSRLAYNIPGNLNQVWGLAFDPVSSRIWFGTEARLPAGGGLWPPDGLRARIVSFQPRTTSNVDDPGIDPIDNFSFPTTNLTCVPGTLVGTCSSTNADISFQNCVSADDCVLAHEICPDGGTNDTDADENCFQEYVLPHTTGAVAHLLVDGDEEERYVYYTVFNGRPPDLNEPPAGTNYGLLGRLDPKDNSTFAQVKEFPLAATPDPGLDCDGTQKNDSRCQAYNYGTHPWQILKSPDGDIVFSQHYARLGRFDTSVTNVDSCTDLDPMTGENPCIQELDVPVGNPAVQYVHSIAYDSDENLWFTLSFASNDPSPSIGYLQPNWSDFTLLPALHNISPLVTGSTSTPNACLPATGGTIGVSAAGIVKDPFFDDMWIADYCRKRILRLRDASSVHDLSWDLDVGTDDAYEHDMQTSPSKPKTTSTQLQLDKNVDGTFSGIKSMAAFRLTSTGAVYGNAVTSKLSMPIVQIGSTRSIVLQIWVGVPNDAAFNPNLFGDIGQRTKIASQVVGYTVTPQTESIDLYGPISRLLDVARRHSAWNQGVTNVIPIYVSRLDTESFTLNVKAAEHSHSVETVLTGVRGGN